MTASFFRSFRADPFAAFAHPIKLAALKSMIGLFFLQLSFFPVAKAQIYPFYNLNVENGLIQSQARGGMAQDKFGNLWIATLGGLSKYDGDNFTNYTVRDGMLSNEVSTITADENGTIWLGDAKGISRVDEKGFTHYRLQSAEYPLANNISEIVPFNKGLWCIADGKVFSFINNKSQELKLPSAHAKATSVAMVKNVLYVAAENGTVYQYKNRNWDSSSQQLPSRGYIFQVFIDSKDRVLLATSLGIYQLLGKKMLPFLVNHKPVQVAITSIAEDKAGTLWAGMGSGVLKLTDTSLKWFNKKNGLSDNPFYHMLTDKEGNVWMASDGQGVFRFSGAEFSSLDERSGLPSAQVMSIAADKKGTIFLGTYEAGLYSFENGKIHKIKLPEDNNAVMAMCYAHNALWMGIFGSGLLEYNGKTFKRYTTKNSSLPSNHISTIYNDDENRLWVGTVNGLAYKKGNEFVSLPLKDVTIQDLVSIGYDSILIATSNGIKFYHHQKLEDFKTGAAPDSATAQCLLKRGNELWIGSSDNGLIYYNLRSQKSFVLNKSNGLQSDFIYNIIDDNEGNIWIGTGFGIHKITYREGKKPLIHFYGKEQGISGMESNHNAALKMPDGSIWFGTTNGAAHYSPSATSVTAAPITIVMQSVKLFGENISDTAYFDSTDHWYKIPYGLRLPFKKNNLTFTFHAVSLTSGERIIYRYRIKGLDAPWSEWSGVNTVTYPALPPGKYTLQVQSRAQDDEKMVRELNYPFEIITPFHQTWLFRFSILGACILLGVTLQYIANRRKQNRLKLVQALRKEEQDKVRQRTAEDFHDEIGNKLTRINILTNVLKNKIGPTTPDTERILHQIQDNTGQLYSGTRDILWSLKPSNDNLQEILNHIKAFGADLFQDTEIEFVFEGADPRWNNYRLPLDVSRNLIMIFKEALNNCLKYSHATKVVLNAALKNDDRLEMSLADDGNGFDMETVKKGHGLDNMTIRSKRINGILAIHSLPETGTLISLNFRLLPDLPLKRG
ncbi:MAG TPA: two-component regulator propeller domain-containing protein [Flavipsychrobacter sp.]|nr:two-component regulator propeller domain-containing protein [Flavipsychrobacter sp.]